jgi:hypothetical protein
MMNIQDELRSLSRISENFRKNKGPKSKWPAEFQLRVLRLIDFGFSPQALAKKLKIPVQTYYHWRRVWKKRPKLSSIFRLLGCMAIVAAISFCLRKFRAV